MLGVGLGWVAERFLDRNRQNRRDLRQLIARHIDTAPHYRECGQRRDIRRGAMDAAFGRDVVVGRAAGLGRIARTAWIVRVAWVVRVARIAWIARITWVAWIAWIA